MLASVANLQLDEFFFLRVYTFSRQKTIVTISARKTQKIKTPTDISVSDALIRRTV